MSEQRAEPILRITPGQQITIELAGLGEEIQHGPEVREYLREARTGDVAMLQQWEPLRGELHELEGLSDEQKSDILSLCATFMGLARISTIRRLQDKKMLKRGF